MRTFVPNLLLFVDAPITAKYGDERKAFWIAPTDMTVPAKSEQGKVDDGSSKGHGGMARLAYAHRPSIVHT